MSRITLNELCKAIESAIGVGESCSCCVDTTTAILKHLNIEVVEYEKSESEYVLQNVQAGYVGNDILFWAKNGNGYCCNLDDAEIFTLEEAGKILSRCESNKFKLWKKSDLDAIAKRHVDHQYLRQIEDVGI